MYICNNLFKQLLYDDTKKSLFSIQNYVNSNSQNVYKIFFSDRHRANIDFIMHYTSDNFSLFDCLFFGGVLFAT